MQIEHRLSSQMEHSTEVPLQLMISQVSPDRIPGLVIWKDINARYAQLGCVRLQTGAIINQHQPHEASALPDVISTLILKPPRPPLPPHLTNIMAGDGLS